jgi:hypothetical protein
MTGTQAPKVTFGVAPTFKCDCGAIIISEAENLGVSVRCAACHTVVALELDRLVIRIPKQFCPGCGYKTLWSRIEGDVCSNCGWEGDGIDPDKHEHPEGVDTFGQYAHRATVRILPGVGEKRSFVIELAVDRDPGFAAAD